MNQSKNSYNTTYSKLRKASEDPQVVVPSHHPECCLTHVQTSTATWPFTHTYHVLTRTNVPGLLLAPPISHSTRGPVPTNCHTPNSQPKMVNSVELTADAYLVCLTHALSTEKEEVMGLLLGEVSKGLGTKVM